MWQLGVIVIIFILYYLKYAYGGHERKYIKFYSLPGPKHFPFIGHTYKFLKKEFHEGMREIFMQVGLPCLVYIPMPHYCTADLEDIKILLNHPNVMAKSELYKVSQKLVGNGLISAPAKMWKTNRKILSKAFNKSFLDSFVPIFYKHSCILKEKLLGNTNNLYKLFEMESFNVFLETSCGIDIDDDKKEKLLKTISRALKVLVRTVVFRFIMWDFMFNMTADGKLFKQLIKDYKEIINSIIKERNCYVQETTDSLGKMPILDILTQSEKEGKYNTEDIYNEMATFATAGTDSSAQTLEFACILLGMNPHIQEKVFEEVMSTIGPTKDIDYMDLQYLKYTEMVILETLRLFPIVTIIGRTAEDDIDIGHCIIPSGTSILVSIFDLHRNEKYYPNPETFDPNRFSPEEMKKRDPSAFMPFSLGPRGCIGWLYSLMMMKTTIANIVRSYKISSKYKSVRELNYKMRIILKLTEPVDCQFTKR